MIEAKEFAPIAPEVNSVAPQSDDNEVYRVKSQFEEADAFKKPFSKDWSRYHLIYSGRHWDGRQPEWMATPVVPMTFSTIQTILPILTDSRPQITVMARQPEHEHVGSVLRMIVEWLWEKNDLDALLPKTMLNTLIFGNGFLKVLWDQSARNGLGDVRVVAVDPAHIFVSPHARTLEEADYVIHAENLPWGMVKRMFPALLPGTKGAAERKLSLDRAASSVGPTNGGATEYIRATDGSSVMPYRTDSSDEGATGLSDDKVVTVYERWEKKDDGTMWQTVVANDQMLKHEPSPFEHGRFPFVHFVDHPCTWTFWAMGEVQQVEKLQIEINRRRGHLIDILRYTASPILVVDPASGIEYESLVARPGLVIPAEGGTNSVGWLQPPQIPSAMFEINEIDKRDFDMALGNVDVLQGRRPEGIEAGVAIEMLQEAANVRMRLKVRHMENSLRKLGELLVAMVQEFYTTERVFAIAGRELSVLEKPLTKDGYLTINQPQGIGPDGQPQLGNSIPTLADGEFDVRIGPGSTLPVSRAHNFQKVLTLYTMQLVDDEEVLKSSGLPRWDEVLQRSRAYWQQKMMAAQQAAMAQDQAATPVDEQVPEEEPSDDEMLAGMAEGASAPPPGMDENPIL